MAAFESRPACARIRCIHSLVTIRVQAWRVGDGIAALLPPLPRPFVPLTLEQLCTIKLGPVQLKLILAVQSWAQVGQLVEDGVLLTSWFVRVDGPLISCSEPVALSNGLPRKQDPATDLLLWWRQIGLAQACPDAFCCGGFYGARRRVEARHDVVSIHLAPSCEVCASHEFTRLAADGSSFVLLTPRVANPGSAAPFGAANSAALIGSKKNPAGGCLCWCWCCWRRRRRRRRAGRVVLHADPFHVHSAPACKVPPAIDLTRLAAMTCSRSPLAKSVTSPHAGPPLLATPGDAVVVRKRDPA